MLTFGRFKISLHNFGFFRLDGGSMFGSVPKNIWATRIPVDEENCIKLATRSLLFRDSERCFLVDVGMGEKWNEKSRKIFAVQNTPSSQLGFNPNDVTDIILTHLHFDHAGGISKYKAPGSEEVVLCYPKARVHLQEDNLLNAKSPTVKERASYLKENVAVLEKANLNLVRGSVEIHPDIWVHQVNGHTRGQQWIEVKSEKESIVYPTDLIPTARHLPIPFHMGYDICAGTLLDEKEKFLAAALKNNSIVVFEHDPDTPAVRVGKDERGHYCVKEVINFD